MNISVLGCGRWGSFLAWYHSAKNDVTLWGREGSRSLAALRETGGNRYLKLPERVCLTSDLGAALESAQLVVISISAQELRALARCIQAYPVAGKTFILCMKGLECGTGDRLTQVFRSEVTQPVSVAVWVGPGHVEDFTAGVPNCMVVDSDDRTVVDFIVETMSTDLIRLYKGGDLVGTEVGAAAKNVIGIAAGMLDGKGLSSLKGSIRPRSFQATATTGSSERAISKVSRTEALPKACPLCAPWWNWGRAMEWNFLFVTRFTPFFMKKQTRMPRCAPCLPAV